MTQKPDSTRISIAWQDSAMLQIGKLGVTEGLVKEATRLLKKHRYIKVRLLRSALVEVSKEEVVESLCEACKATLDGFRGNTAVIYRLR
jgi:RNA-binding protein YhbY